MMVLAYLFKLKINETLNWHLSLSKIVIILTFLNQFFKKRIKQKMAFIERTVRIFDLDILTQTTV